MTWHTLYLARHGETSWNHQKRWQGQADIALNETGKAQALALARSVEALGVKRLFSSQMVRAKETAEIAARHLGIPYAGDDARLAERSFGLFEGLTRTEVETKYPKEWRQYQEDRRHLPPGGESFEILIARLHAGLLDQVGQPTTLIVTHGGCMRSLWAAHDHQRYPDPSRGAANHVLKIQPIKNCAVMRLDASERSGELHIKNVSLVVE